MENQVPQAQPVKPTQVAPVGRVGQVKPARGESMLKPLTPKNSGKGGVGKTIGMVVVVIVVIGLGSLTGFKMAGGSFASSGGSEEVAPGAKKSPMEAGIDDEDAFPDNAEGILVQGGIEGEGTHHLERGGDESKYTYMVSTVIDLEGFLGKKVEVWGETIAAQSAPWLMDVGKIKVIE